MISMVTDIAPECFKSCPQMCQPLDGLVTEYMATQDTNAIKARVCANTAPFGCMFEAGNIGSCGTVLSAGSALGVELPMSAAALQEQCSSSSNLRGGGAQYHDVQSGNSSAITNSSNTSLTADIGAAAGQGARLLGLLAPVALLFAT